jgi:hypothetical protein
MLNNFLTKNKINSLTISSYVTEPFWAEVGDNLFMIALKLID